jgi:hypothetical protein
VSSDLGVFSTVRENFFVTNVAGNKGIQCRFGMKGVIAEAHYDGGRNMVRVGTARRIEAGGTRDAARARIDRRSTVWRSRTVACPATARNTNPVCRTEPNAAIWSRRVILGLGGGA